MPPLVLSLGWVLAAQVGPTDNPVFQTLVEHGVEAPGGPVPLPRPSLADARDASAARAVLQDVVGDDRSIANFVRDSVSAPFVLKTRDVKGSDATTRVADLWFVVHANLDEVDLKQVLGKTDETTVEAGNMRFTSKLLTSNDLGARKLDRLPDLLGRDEWYTHATGRLLDRIALEATDRVVATRTADSLTVAALTSRAFDSDPTWPNRWSPITRTGATETIGSPQVYLGGGSYVKITKLVADPGALFVEAHFAFNEPQPWFAGNPILRSKFSVICQDQVRQLRREIQQRRTRK